MYGGSFALDELEIELIDENGGEGMHLLVS